MSLPASAPAYRVFVGVDIAAASATVVTMTDGTFSRPITIVADHGNLPVQRRC